MLRLHLISDSTGETLRSFARASLAHFELDEGYNERVWSLVRSAASLAKVLEAIRQDPGIVLYTLADKTQGETIEAFCADNGLPVYGLLEHSIEFFSGALKLAPTRHLVSMHYQYNEDSLRRLMAMEYALTHDDGQSPQGYVDADVVVVGVSRTSKTPTCIYLANRGIKAANYPLVPGTPIPPELSSLSGVLVVGLTLSARHLLDMRRTRLDQLGQSEINAYVDHENIRLEISDARRIYSANNWHVIDVTRRSIEETAAMIIQELDRRQS